MRTTALALLIACLLTSVVAQEQPAKPSSEPTQKQTGSQKAAPTGTAPTTDAQSDDNEAQGPWKGMQYRLVGPFRGGRVVAVSGVVGQNDVYYFGAVAGGVWKTTDGGLTFKPIFDKTKDASPSIGAYCGR